jgi:DNA-binding SARP family transcriptional activator
VEFRLLGPVEAVIGGKPIAIGAARQEIVLAQLLLELDHVVSVDRLIDALWPDEPPRTAKSQVQITISALRQLLGADVIVTRPPGYLITVPPDALDLTRYEKLTASASRAAAEQRPHDALHDLREALALWRGPALYGLQGEVLRAAAAKLNESRISAYQECLTLELQLGRHHEIIAELTELVAEHPLDERFRGQLMLALYRGGRQADALEVFRAGREILRDELGLDPGDDLLRLEQAMLTRDAQLESPGPRQPAGLPGKAAAALVPRQLPRTIADFTGREEVLAEIGRVLTGADASGLVPDVPVVVLTGRGGMGKTALAVRAAHLASSHFPDGQLYMQLRPDMRHTSASLLEQLLRSVGVHPDAVPRDLDGRAAMYRSMLAGRHVLIVIDGAFSTDHIIPFLPGTPGCAAIVTSVQLITGLEGVHQVHIGSLDEKSAHRLLETLVGAARMSAEPDAARELVQLCEGIPLALRVVAAKLSVRPHWRIAHMLVQLRDETRRLDELDLDGASVRATLALAYETLSEPARQLLRRLTLLGTADFASWVGAPLLGAGIGDAEDLLQQLVASHLVEANVSEDYSVRFHLHDLVRIYAAERLATAESTADRLGSMQRLLSCWLFITTTAYRRIHSGDFAVLHGTAEQWPLPAQSVALLLQDPIDWFRTERNSLVTAIFQAAQLGMDELCWDLATTSVTLFESGLYNDDWRDSHAAALEVVRHAGNKRGEAALLYSLGTLELRARVSTASHYFEQALKIFTEIDDSQGRAMARGALALVDSLEGNYEKAMAGYRLAIAGFRAGDDLASEGYTLKMMAQIAADQLDFAAAEELLDEALTIARRLNFSRLTAQVQYALAELALHRGRVESATDALASVLRLTREIGDIVGQAYTLTCLGNARRILGEFGGARSAFDEALELAGSVGDRLIRARVLLGLAELHVARGEEHAALTRADEALAVFREHGEKGIWQARVLALLGRVHEQAGRPDIAAHAWRGAADLVGETDATLAEEISAALDRLQAAGLAEARAAADRWIAEARPAADRRLSRGSTGCGPPDSRGSTGCGPADSGGRGGQRAAAGRRIAEAGAGSERKAARLAGASGYVCPVAVRVRPRTAG